jgi:DNA gyrase/topoisomerase IV subunit B
MPAAPKTHSAQRDDAKEESREGQPSAGTHGLGTDVGEELSEALKLKAQRSSTATNRADDVYRASAMMSADTRRCSHEMKKMETTICYWFNALRHCDARLRTL